MFRWIASVGGAGFAPIAPGTAGSAVALAAWFLLRPGPAFCAALIGSLSILAIVSIPHVERSLGASDPRMIVIDEAAGMLLAVWALPVSWGVGLAGCVLFRVFDILKPPPIRQLERLPSPWGVLLDDLAAGLLTNVIIRIILISDFGFRIAE